MKYKVGDIIILKSKEKLSNEIGISVRNFSKWDKKRLRIAEVVPEVNSYRVEGLKYLIMDSMIEGLAPNQIEIDIPEGYEIDKENSTFSCIIFKPKVRKVKVWDDLLGTKVKGAFVSNTSGLVSRNIYGDNKFSQIDRNVFIDKAHAQSSIAAAQISQLLPYYGGEITEAEWKTGNTFYVINKVANMITITASPYYSLLAFHTREQAIEFWTYNTKLIKKYLMIWE